MPDAHTSRLPADRTAHPRGEVLAHQLMLELSDIRRRGLDDLDLDTHKKDPRSVPNMKRLAKDYAEACGLAGADWVVQIRTLLRDGLDAYAAEGNVDDSRFVSDLFFDPPEEKPDPAKPKPRRGPSELFAMVRAREGMVGKEYDSPFAEKRRNKFLRFAKFLITFVNDAQRAAVTQPTDTASTSTPAPALPSAEEQPPPAGAVARRQMTRGRLVLSAVSLIAVIGALGALLFTGHLGLGSLGARRAPTGSASPTAHYQPGKTYTETTGEYGTATFTDPHRPAVQGPRIEAYTNVQVACKVFAPTIPSISPDGYWYRVVSPQQFANLYAPATNFLNGDPVVGARKHYTDFAVPDCPG